MELHVFDTGDRDFPALFIEWSFVISGDRVFPAISILSGATFVCDIVDICVPKNVILGTKIFLPHLLNSNVISKR